MIFRNAITDGISGCSCAKYVSSQFIEKKNNLEANNLNEHGLSKFLLISEIIFENIVGSEGTL